MAFASRKGCYTVQEVLDEIQGDDSDFGTDADSDDEDYVFLCHAGAHDAIKKDRRQAASDEERSSDNDVPFAQWQSRQESVQRAYRWNNTTYIPPQVSFHGPSILPTDPAGITETPLQYFRRFVTHDMLELIAEFTNHYSVQRLGKCVNTNVKEVEQMLGMYFRMGLVEMSGVRMYWENESRYPPVADIMSRNRFQLLLSVIHFVDNETTDEETKKDGLWKLRPFLAMFRQQCLKVTPKRQQSINEMMVPFKGKFPTIRHYIRGTPHHWGFKVWARCSVDGFLHDFAVFQGRGGVHQRQGNLDLGGETVVQLCETLEKHVGYQIFTNSCFTSMGLIEKLLEFGFMFTGTVRSNRLAKCPLPSKQAMKKKGRGYYEYKVESKSNVVCLRWQDTNPVTLMSSYAGPDPVDKARRWDKTQKDYIEVDHPFIIKEYNTNMAGVDTLDAHVSCCKFSMRSNRWYLTLFWHFITLGMVNAWLLYKRDCELLGVTGSAVHKLRRFQAMVAQGLIEVGTAKKSCWPSLDNNDSTVSLRLPRMVRVKPSDDARYDQVAHWPVKKEKRRRCSVCKTIKTDTNCEKCQVPLCFNERRNCYREYHHN